MAKRLTDSGALVVADSSHYAKIGGIPLPKKPVTASEINAWLATLPPVPFAGDVA